MEKQSSKIHNMSIAFFCLLDLLNMFTLKNYLFVCLLVGSLAYLYISKHLLLLLLLSIYLCYVFKAPVACECLMITDN